MKTVITILALFCFSGSYSQFKKCLQPIAAGDFAPIILLPDSNYTFGMTGQGMNGEGIDSFSYSILTGSGTLVNANSQSASIINLKQGFTTVRLIISDSCGSKDSSYIVLTVKPAQAKHIVKVRHVYNTQWTYFVYSDGSTSLYTGIASDYWDCVNSILTVTYTNGSIITYQ
jgi:hypothetical protein